MSKIPTIAMIPSGYKANKVYSVLPTNGDGDLATTRTSEATRINQQGLIEEVATGVPRLDYSDGGCPALSLEPQSTNLITYSEDFTQTEWTSLSTATLSATTTITPSGSTNAVKVTNTSGGEEDLREVVPVVIGETYTVSVWVRRVVGSGVVSILSIENLTTPIAVTNEWQRFSVTATATSTSGRLYVRISELGDEIEVWGAQLEEQSYATSYIPTSGATATRVAETLSKTGLSNYINSSEGVLYAEISAFQDIPSANSYITLGDGARTSPISLRLSTIGEVIFYHSGINNSDIVSFISQGNVDLTQYNKFALRYGSSASECSLFFNGVKQSDNGSFVYSALSTLNKLSFSEDLGGDNFYGKIKDLRVYNEALTDSELQQLTS